MYKRVIKRKSMENRLLNKIEDTQYWVKEAILTLMLTRLEMENFDHLFLDMLGRLRNGKWVNADTMLALVLSQRSHCKEE